MSCFDVPTTQISIFIFSVSARILFEGDFSLWVSWNKKNVTDNKLFWKFVKLYFQRNHARDRISISEKGEILKIESETAETLNIFFSNIVKNLNISRYSEFDSITENTADQNLKAIFKYKDHPSMLAIQSNCEKKHFVSRLTLKTLKKDMLKLDKNKASQTDCQSH